MNTPLIEVNDAGLIARAYNLGLKVVPNIPHVLSVEDLDYWEGHLPELKDVLANSLVRSKPIPNELTKKKPVQFLPLPQVTSNGRSGADWVTHLKKEKFNLSNWAIDVMTKGKDTKGNLGFVASNGVTYKPVVIKGEEFTDAERVTSNIRKVATELKLITPPAELEPLIREAISDEDMAKMGLDWLVTMHEPIIDSDDVPHLLGSSRLGDGRGLYTYSGRPTLWWNRLHGFVFLAPQD